MRRACGLLLAVLAATALSACDLGRGPAPCSGDTVRITSCLPPTPDAGRPVDAEIVSFDPQAAVAVPGAVDDAPIARDALLGWTAAEGPYAPVPPPEPVADVPGTTYVAASGSTGCRVPESVAVSVSGDDLRVEFIGGTAHQECVRPYVPYVQIAVADEAVDGVTRVQGEPVVDAAGPAELADFVRLNGGEPDPAGTAPAELGHTDGLRTALTGANVAITDEVRVALDREPDPGDAGYAYLLHGCGDVSAVLVIAPETLTARPVGGGDTDCESPEYYLATFTVPREYVPTGAVPTAE